MPACEQDLSCVDPGLGSGGVLVQAVETLRTFEKKDSRVKSAAATNLSFLFFLVSLQVNDFEVTLQLQTRDTERPSKGVVTLTFDLWPLRRRTTPRRTATPTWP